MLADRVEERDIDNGCDNILLAFHRGMHTEDFVGYVAKPKPSLTKPKEAKERKLSQKELFAMKPKNASKKYSKGK